MSTNKILLGLTLMILFCHPLHTQAQDIVTDSAVYIKKKIKEDFKATKRKKGRQIKRIETKDSVIIYGADKLRTHIILVFYWKKSDKRKERSRVPKRRDHRQRNLPDVPENRLMKQLLKLQNAPAMT